MSEAFRDLPPPPSQRVAELHAWIATYRSGAEGIIAVTIPGRGREPDESLPLVSSKRKTMESLGELARRAVSLGQNAADPPITAQLVSFRRIESAGDG